MFTTFLKTDFFDISSEFRDKNFEQTTIFIDCSNSYENNEFEKFKNITHLKLKNYSPDFNLSIDLKNLEYLDLSDGMSGAISDEKIAIHHLPKEIIAHKTLKHINLDYELSAFKKSEDEFKKMCDSLINDLSALPMLESLSLHHNDLKTIEVLAPLQTLTSLNLTRCSAIRSLKGLEKIPLLKNLKIGTYIEESEDSRKILELCTHLQELHGHDHQCDDLAALFKQIKHAPLEENIRTSIPRATSAKSLIVALNNLYLYIDKYEKHLPSPLLSIFKIENTIKKPIVIDELASAFKKYHAAFSNLDLSQLIEYSFRNRLDNFDITLNCIDELITRTDIKSEKRLIEHYLRVMNVDTDHDPDNYLVADIMKHNYFKKFCIQSQIMLLKNRSQLSSEYGKGFEKQFAYCFAHANAEKTLLLTSILVEFYMDNHEYFYDEYFQELFNDIKVNVNETTYNELIRHFK